MTQPRFSVVIPTRNRAETLVHCLQTCLSQEYDNYEIIVSDNCSSPETRRVAEQFKSPKIKYVRADEPLAMNASWEFGVSQTTGEYVMLLGDDDGLMPWALRELDRIILQTQVKAIAWDQCLYTWPEFPLADEANYLTFKLTRTATMLNGKASIASALKFEMGINFLPMVYHGVVHQSVLAQIRQTAGKVFLAFAPDSNAGISIAYLVGQYLFLDVPMTLSGMAGKSNNVAGYRVNPAQAVSVESWNKDVAGKRDLHPWVPDIAIFPVVTAESFLRSKEALFPHDNSLVLDRQFYAQAYISTLSLTDPVERQDAIRKIHDSLADLPNIQAWFDQIVPRFQPAPKLKYTTPFRGTNGDAVFLSADQFGIQNIADAVKFVSTFLGYKGGQINYDLPARTQVAAELQQVKQQLTAAQTRIQELERQSAPSFSSSFQMPFPNR